MSEDHFLSDEQRKKNEKNLSCLGYEKQPIINHTYRKSNLTSLALASSPSADHVMMTRDGFILDLKLQGRVMLSPLANS